MSWKVPLFRIHWDDEDLRAVDRAIRRGMSWAIGPEVLEFEKRLADYVGTRHAVVFNSGTSALHAVLLAHGIGPGVEVIVPSFTFIATANAVLMAGATPVFADVDEASCGLDPEDVARKITRRTRAILPVHFGGSACRVEELRDLARRRRLLLIEDAAESLGATVNGRKVGTFGDSAVLSFCQNKVITTGEGGAIVTDSAKVRSRLQLIRSHGRRENGEYFGSSGRAAYVQLGYNFRMSNLTAALGMAQLAKIEKVIRLRRRHAAGYSRAFQALSPVRVLAARIGVRHVYQLYTIRARQRNRLQAHLTRRGVHSKVYFPPVHLTPFHRRLLRRLPDLPVTRRLASEVLSLPIYPDMTARERDAVIRGVKSFCDSG